MGQLSSWPQYNPPLKISASNFRGPLRRNACYPPLATNHLFATSAISGQRQGGLLSDIPCVVHQTHKWLLTPFGEGCDLSSRAACLKRLARPSEPSQPSFLTCDQSLFAFIAVTALMCLVYILRTRSKTSRANLKRVAIFFQFDLVATARATSFHARQNGPTKDSQTILPPSVSSV